MSTAKFNIVDGIALWLFLVGVWPLADPGHDGGTLLSMIDLTVHAAALLVLVMRWKVQLVRRNGAS